jgi:hypothetical protein
MHVKNLILFFLIGFIGCRIYAQEDNSVYLLVRADDMGSFHAANEACLKSLQSGIARSVSDGGVSVVP